MSVITKDLGAVTAYAAAVNRGYTGTKEEFETLMASYAYVGEQAAESASNASQSATNASQSATDAETAKGTAQQAATDAQTAQTSAQGYAQSAQQSAQSASQSAQDAESAKDTAVNAVDGFAAGAQQALDSVNQAGNNWKSLAQAKALDSEAYALGTRDGEDVGSSDPAYHNNAKYYAEQGGASAQTASEAAQTATTKAGEAQASANAAAESARTLTIDATLTQSGQAADSKVVGDKIGELKANVNQLSNGKTTISGAFSYGIFNSSNMPETDPRKFNAVMMTAEKYDREITIKANDGYNFLAYFYNASGTYVSKSARWETSMVIPVGTNFRLWVRPNPLDTSITLDLDTVKQNITFNAPIQDEIEASAKNVALANANVNLSGAGLQMIDTSFAYGTMNTTTGQAVSDPGYKYQVIMPNYVTYDRDVTIRCGSGYRYQVWWYNEDDTYISRTGSFRTDADEYTVTAGTHFRLFITLNPPDTSANVPIETFAENIFISTKINDRVTAVETKPLSTLPEYILNTMSYRQVGVLSKGYILLSCDDGTAGLATYTIPMLIDKGVPATFGLLTTSPVITNESYLSTVLDAINNHSCCVAQHGSAQWTTYAEDALNKYFDDTEALFTEKGITEIHGAICPGGAVADTNALVKAIAGGRFGSVFSGGLLDEVKYGSYNAVGARTNMYAMARYSAIAFTQQTYQQAIDDAYDNHYILCPFWHDYSVVDDTAKQAIIEGMIDYAKTKGLTFITMADLPTII